MKKIILGIIVIAILFLIYIIAKPSIQLGGYGINYAYYDATNASSTIPVTATTTSPVLTVDSTRTNALVCNISTSTVYLFPESANAVTSVRLGSGIPLFATTTTNGPVCMDFPGFKGYLFGISTDASKVTVSEWK